MRKLFFLIVLGVLGSCKDNCPDPNGTGSNGTGNTGGTGTEYTIKGKLLNGTTMEPINPGMEMTLIAQNNGLAVKREELGTCKIQDDGSFELKYLYSEVAAISTAFMRFESQFYISEYLPRNQSLDTILYESTLGTVVLVINRSESKNRVYFAYRIAKDSLVSDSSDTNESRFISVRSEMPGFGVYYDTAQLDIRKDDLWGNVVYGDPMQASIKMRGDPFIDTLRIQY